MIIFHYPTSFLFFSTKSLELSYDAADLQSCDVVFVCVKCGDTRRATPLRSLKPGATIVSLQNGTENASILRRLVPSHTVVAGMVPHQQQPEGTVAPHLGMMAPMAQATVAPHLGRLTSTLRR